MESKMRLAMPSTALCACVIVFMLVPTGAKQCSQADCATATHSDVCTERCNCAWLENKCMQANIVSQGGAFKLKTEEKKDNDRTISNAGLGKTIDPAGGDGTEPDTNPIPPWQDTDGDSKIEDGEKKVESSKQMDSQGTMSTIQQSGSAPGAAFQEKNENHASEVTGREDKKAKQGESSTDDNAPDDTPIPPYETNGEDTNGEDKKAKQGESSTDDNAPDDTPIPPYVEGSEEKPADNSETVSDNSKTETKDHLENQSDDPQKLGESTDEPEDPPAPQLPPYSDQKHDDEELQKPVEETTEANTGGEESTLDQGKASAKEPVSAASADDVQDFRHSDPDIDGSSAIGRAMAAMSTQLLPQIGTKIAGGAVGSARPSAPQFSQPVPTALDKMATDISIEKRRNDGMSAGMVEEDALKTGSLPSAAAVADDHLPILDVGAKDGGVQIANFSAGNCTNCTAQRRAAMYEQEARLEAPAAIQPSAGMANAVADLVGAMVGNCERLTCKDAEDELSCSTRCNCLWTGNLCATVARTSTNVWDGASSYETRRPASAASTAAPGTIVGAGKRASCRGLREQNDCKQHPHCAWTSVGCITAALVSFHPRNDES